MEAALRQALDDLPGQRKPARGWWLPIASIAIAAATLVGSLATRHPATPASGNLTSLAVLPLKFVSGENEAPYLADALTDQLITTLGQIHSIKVMAQTSVSRFKDTTLPIADIAKQLNVDGVIEGTVAVQRQADGAPARARVNVRVVRAGTDLELWSGSLERPVGDMMALEAELARTIARQIHGALNPQEARQLRAVRTTSPEADQAYLQGRYHLTHSSAEARLALEAFQRALQFDPNHASAHAGAARSYIALGFDNLLTYPQSRAAALADATKAVELDPDLAEAHAVLADLKFYYDWDWHAADREYQRAVNLEPSSTYARSQYARYLSAAKRVDEAVSQASMAATLDPLSSEAAVTLGLMLHYARRDAEAVTALERALSLDPGSGAARFVLGRVHEAQGKRDEAIAETDRAIASADHIAAAWTVQAVCLRARAGRVPEARATFSQLLETLQAQRIRFNPEYEGKIRLALGEVDRGMTLLEQAVAERDPAVLWFAVDPRLDPYRTHPRFTHVIAQLGIP
jgi:TolB-like protein/lipoprotein NlpI